MKFSIALLALLVGLSIGGCTSSTSTVLNSQTAQETSVPNSPTSPETTIDYSDLFITGELPDNSSKITFSEFESRRGQKLPVPAYLPQGYEIKEIYYYLFDIYLVLISDQPVQWTGNQYRCRLAFVTQWGGVSGGFKWLAGKGEFQYLPGTNNLCVLVNEDDVQILWWQNYSTYKEGYERRTALLSLYANRQLPKDELIQIALSVPEMLPPTKPKPESTATPRPATHSPDEPPPFTQIPPDSGLP